MDMQHGILYIYIYIDNPIPKVGFFPPVFCEDFFMFRNIVVERINWKSHWGANFLGASQCPVLGSNLSTELRTFEASEMDGDPFFPDNREIMGKITTGDLYKG